MTETRRLAAILAADIAGYSRLASLDEERTLARFRALRGDLVDPAVAARNGRVIKRTGDGALVEFRSVVDAVRCAIEVQDGMQERNAGLPPDRRIEFRIGVHLGDVVEESDGDLMGDGVNIAARLEGICEPGGVLISEDAWRLARDRLDETFVDLGERKLKNIPRPIGARLLPAERFAGKREPSLAARETPGPDLPEKPSIAVLPFENMSGDSEQDYFADGMVEDIVTGLSRIKWLFVIARNSSAVYKGKATDARQIGRELGVRYLLEGSVRKAGARLRITAQLVEAQTGAHLWADKFDGALEDVFDLQDQITDRVVGIIEPSRGRSEIERSRRKRPENLGAYDLFLRALPRMQARMPDEPESPSRFREALELDARLPVAHAHLAWCREWCFTRGGFEEADKSAASFTPAMRSRATSTTRQSLAVAGWVIIVLTKEHEWP